MNAPGELWAERARENLRMGELAYANDIWTQTCFHAQQCVEMILKAVLASADHSIPRTHAIGDLLGLLDATTAQALAGNANALRHLDLYYLPTRYPDALPAGLPSGLPGQPEAVEALRVATNVMGILDY